MESLAGRVGQWWPGVALGNTDRGTAVSRGPSLTWLVRVGGDLQFGWWASWLQPAASGGEWHGPQPRQGGEELGFPRPAPGQMQYEAPGLAGDASGQGKEAPPEGLGGRHRLAQSDAPGPAGLFKERTFETTLVIAIRQRHKPKQKITKRISKTEHRENPLPKQGATGAENKKASTPKITQTPEERREYERARSQTPERKEYRRQLRREQIRIAKETGKCKDCSNPAIPGQTKCETCAEKHRQRRRKDDANRRAKAKQAKDLVRATALEERTAAGGPTKCRDCRNPPRPGQTRCERCAIRHNGNRRRGEAKKRAQAQHIV